MSHLLASTKPRHAQESWRIKVSGSEMNTGYEARARDAEAL